jgi:hypothetical protein
MNDIVSLGGFLRECHILDQKKSTTQSLNITELKVCILEPSFHVHGISDQTEPWHEQFQGQVQVVVVLILHTLQQHRLATHHMAHPENCSCGHSFLKESLIALNLRFQVGIYTCSCSWWRSTKSPTKNVIKRAWCQDTATWYGPSTSHYLTISFGTLWSW